MNTNTLLNLALASQELKQMASHGREQAARPDAQTICRLGDDAIKQYQETSESIDKLLDRFKGIVIVP